MNEEFVQRIENPRSVELEELFDKALENVQSEFPSLDEWTLRKLTYIYYYDWKQDNPEYLFLLEDPGSLDDRHRQRIHRIQALRDNFAVLDLISIYREIGLSWLVDTRNSDFTNRFLAVFENNGLISIEDNWEDYMRSGGFFGDFYMTDVIKYRAESSDVGPTEINTSFSEYLAPELEHIGPKLIIVFGKRAWNIVRRQLQTEPVGEEIVQETMITEVHGHLFKTRRLLDTYVLVLGHMSTNFYGAQISREEYMGRLDEGLEQWKLLI